MATDEKIGLDKAVLNGAEFVARSLGHGDTWDAGLGHIFGRVVGASDISRRPISVASARTKLGLTEQNIETGRALAELGRRLLLKR